MQEAQIQEGTATAHVEARRNPTMRIHLWCETSQGVLFGLGRLALLREVERCGSLKGAAENLGMSYRGAWGKIKTTEEALGEKLIERAGCRRAGYRLTPYGRAMAASFDEWFKEIEDYALDKGRELLPFVLQKYE